jgi:hypothetical protein
VKALTTAACLLLGLVVGLSSVALHHYWWGLLLAIAATTTTAYALPPGWWARMPFAFGWVAMVGYLALPRDEGDYVIAADAQGYALLAFAVALPVAAMVTLRPLRRGSPATEESPS